MTLSSIQLDAFLAVCRTQSFTQAASALNVTQSALSQRIKNLEDELGTTLFARDPVRVTETGTRLLRYCQAKESLENEFMATLKSPKSGELRGTLRIAAFSTVAKSLILPALKPLLQKNENLSFELIQAELGEIPSLLLNGSADFAFTNEPIRRQDVRSELLGHERNVVVHARHGTASKQAPAHVFFDHDEADQTTIEFFRHQKRELPKSFRRSFASDIETILAAVQMGLGRAIAPKHLVEQNKALEVAKSYGEQKIPVYLSTFEQPFYTALHQAAYTALSAIKI